MRFRISQLIHKILDNLGEDAKIDDDLYDKIYDCMLERLRDKIPIVRMHAVLALTRLQNPRDENCPVIKGNMLSIVHVEWRSVLEILGEYLMNINNRFFLKNILESAKLLTFYNEKQFLDCFI